MSLIYCLFCQFAICNTFTLNQITVPGYEPTTTQLWILCLTTAPRLHYDSSCLYLNGKTFVILHLKGRRCFLGSFGFCWANSRMANLSNIQLVMTILGLSAICKIHLHSKRNIFPNYLINFHSIKLHKNGLFKCLLHSHLLF